MELLLHYKSMNETEQKEWHASLSEAARKQFDHLSKEVEEIRQKNSHKEKYPLNLNIL